VSKGVPYFAYNINFFFKKTLTPLCQLIEWIALYEPMPKHVHEIKPTPNAKGFVSKHVHGIKLTPNAKGFVSKHVLYQVFQQNKMEMCIGIEFNN